MDPRVIEHINLVQKTLGGEGEIHVISGYRSPEYNAILVKRSRRAARHSLHVEGQAVDFFIPAVRPREIRQAGSQATVWRGGVLSSCGLHASGLRSLPLLVIFLLPYFDRSPQRVTSPRLQEYH